MNRLIELLNKSVLLFLLITLTACGGGSSTPSNAAAGNASSSSDLLTGAFVDNPVENLRYETPTFRGFTLDNGEFSYHAGETVKFYVGDILIGEAPGAATITPFDLAGMSSIPQTASEVRRTINRLSPSLNPAMPSSMNYVINLAVFLQTIDADGDPQNNIKIPTELHNIASGLSLDFKQHYLTFQADFPLHEFMADARANGLWGGARPVRNPGYALDTLYADLQITPEIRVPYIVENDFNADGTPDSIVRTTYDANGNEASIENDYDADGTPNVIDSFSYDDNGNETSNRTDLNGDGVEDGVTKHSYDANGYLTAFSVDSNADGSPDMTITTTNDPHGLPTQEEQDNDGDGLPDVIIKHFYDDSGNEIKKETTRYTTQGVSNEIRTFSYDEITKRLIKEERDSNGDGFSDTIISYSNIPNALGEKDITKIDNNADSTPDFISFITKDINGNIIEQGNDYDADGKIDHVETYDYDDNGNLITHSIDSNADGTINVVSSFSYDANGNLIKVVDDTNADGTPDRVTSHYYDPDGTYIKTETDNNADGKPNSAIRFQLKLTTVFPAEFYRVANKSN